MLDRVKPPLLQAEFFRSDVLEGLSKPQKTLPSRWLYDDAGSALFEAITRVDEYYPTRTETAILRDFADDIAQFIGSDAVVIEYGAGAGVKTKILLDSLEQPSVYIPVDIAGDFLATTVLEMKTSFPSTRIMPVVADFTSEFRLPAELPVKNRIGFFPGSTIGNLNSGEADAFLRRMRNHVGLGGRAIVGIDLVKAISTLRAAYDDAGGVTAAFNLNMLKRINRELDGNFPLGAFKHVARWNEREKAIEMHLLCLVPCEVNVDGDKFKFASGETIHTESCRKYDLEGINSLAGAAGWSLERVWTDDGGAYAVVGLSAIG
jgi:L-histidine N-alpha-methyltransferase